MRCLNATAQATELSLSCMHKVIRWVLGIGIFLLPLWFLPFTSDVLEFNKLVLVMIIAGLSLILFLIDMIRQGKLYLKTSPVLLGINAIVVAVIIASIASLNRFGSLFGFGDNRAFTVVGWLSFAIIFFIALNVFSEEKNRLREIMTVSLSITFIIAVMNALGVHVFSGPVFGRDTFNTVGSLNGLGFLAAASLPMLLIASGSDIAWRKIAHTLMRYLGLAAALFLIILINWIMVWIVAFIAMLGYLAFASSLELGKGKMRFYAFPMAVIIVGIFLLVTNFSMGGIKKKFPIEVSSPQATTYQIAGTTLRHRPLGYGPEQFFVAYDLYRPASSVNNSLFQIRFSDATSEIGNMLAEGGIPIIIALLLFLWLYGRELVFNIRDGFNGDSSTSKLWASSLAFFLVFFFYPVSITLMIMFLLVTALGIMGSRRFQEMMPREIDLEQRGIYSFTGSVAFVLGLVVVLTGWYFMTTQYVANAQIAKAIKSKDRDVTITALEQSTTSYPRDARTYRALSQAILSKIADELKAGKKDENQQDFQNRVSSEIASAVNNASQATNIDPADSENWMNRGYIYQNLIGIFPGTDQLAIKMYEEVLSRSPANALAYVRMGNVYLTQYDELRRTAKSSQEQLAVSLDSAEHAFKKAIDLYDNYGQAHYNLAATYDRKGALPQAIKSFERVAISNPREPGIMFQLGLLYYRNGQKVNAQAAWERAVFLFSDYSNARWYLSLIYEENGEIEKAIAQLEQIAKFNPDSKIVVDRLVKLRGGGREIPPGRVLDQKPLNNAQ